MIFIILIVYLIIKWYSIKIILLVFITRLTWNYWLMVWISIWNFIIIALSYWMSDTLKTSLILLLLLLLFSVLLFVSTIVFLIRQLRWSINIILLLRRYGLSTKHSSIFLFLNAIPGGLLLWILLAWSFLNSWWLYRYLSAYFMRLSIVISSFLMMNRLRWLLSCLLRKTGQSLVICILTFIKNVLGLIHVIILFFLIWILNGFGGCSTVCWLVKIDKLIRTYWRLELIWLL